MTSISAMSLLTPLKQIGPSAFLPLKPSKSFSGFRKQQWLQVNAFSKVKFEKALTGLSAVLATSMVIQEVAEAAGLGVSPFLKNFLLNIASGGIVLITILGVVVVVSYFDPVKRT